MAQPARNGHILLSHETLIGTLQTVLLVDGETKGTHRRPQLGYVWKGTIHDGSNWQPGQLGMDVPPLCAFLASASVFGKHVLSSSCCFWRRFPSSLIWRAPIWRSREQAGGNRRLHRAIHFAPVEMEKMAGATAATAFVWQTRPALFTRSEDGAAHAMVTFPQSLTSTLILSPL